MPVLALLKPKLLATLSSSKSVLVITSFQWVSNLQEPNWQQISDLFVSVFFIALKRGFPWKFAFRLLLSDSKVFFLTFRAFLIFLSECKRSTLFQLLSYTHSDELQHKIIQLRTSWRHRPQICSQESGDSPEHFDSLTSINACVNQAHNSNTSQHVMTHTTIVHHDRFWPMHKSLRVAKATHVRVSCCSTVSYTHLTLPTKLSV